MNRASYDLTRLRRNGLIIRVDGRNLYRLTDDGLAFAIFYTKVHNRVLRPLLATDRPPAPPPLRAAMRTIDTHLDARSPMRDYRRRPPETLPKCQSPSDQGSLDLDDWRWQGPVKDDGSLGKEGDGKAISVPDDEADTEEMEKYVDDPWFTLVSEGAGAPYVRLRSPAKGATTEARRPPVPSCARCTTPTDSASPHGTRPAPRSTT